MGEGLGVESSSIMFLMSSSSSFCPSELSGELTDENGRGDEYGEMGQEGEAEADAAVFPTLQYPLDWSPERGGNGECCASTGGKQGEKRPVKSYSRKKCHELTQRNQKECVK